MPVNEALGVLYAFYLVAGLMLAVLVLLAALVVLVTLVALQHRRGLLKDGAIRKLADQVDIARDATLAKDRDLRALAEWIRDDPRDDTPEPVKELARLIGEDRDLVADGEAWT